MQIRYQLRRTAVRVATLLLWELQFASTDPIAAERTNLLMAALGAAYPTVLTYRPACRAERHWPRSFDAAEHAARGQLADGQYWPRSKIQIIIGGYETCVVALLGIRRSLLREPCQFGVAIV